MHGSNFYESDVINFYQYSLSQKCQILGIKSLSFGKISIHKQDLQGKSANFNNSFVLFELFISQTLF